jgi:glycosyltransferase involved in cell wall biosynthesis
MASDGHKVRILCIAESPLHRASSAHEEGEGARQDFDIRTIRRGTRYLSFATAMHRATRLLRYGADWLWIRDPRDLDTSAWARRILRLLGGPTRLVFHQGMQIPKPKRSLYHRWRFGAIDAWVTPLDWLKEQVCRNTPLVPHQVHVIPLGLDDKWFVPVSDRLQQQRQARLTLGLSQESFVVTLVGRIDRKKGQDVLVASLVDLPPDVHALIVGDPTLDTLSDYFDEVRSYVRDKELQWRVHFRPYDNFPQSAFIASDVVAVCSTQESVGSVTLEAMASGCAIVGTDTGGTAELLAGGRGWTFPAGDSDALAEALLTLRNHPDAIPPRVEAGAKFIKRHGRQSLTARWTNLLRAPQAE